MHWSHDVPPYLSSYAPVIDRFGAGFVRGRFAYRCCPAHQDATPSLSLWLGTDGRLMFGCYANCRKPDILRAAGLTWADVFPPKDDWRAPVRKEVAHYSYRDQAGKVVYQVVRFEPKDFRQRRPVVAQPRTHAPKDWAWNMEGVERVLYCLPELLAADPARQVLLVEGEKDVHTAQELGFIATTNAGGAKSPWLPSYSETLSGRNVCIVPDQDGAGREWAERVAGALMFCGAEGVRLASLPAKDLTAFVLTLPDSERRRRVEQELRAAPLWRPSKKPGA